MAALSRTKNQNRPSYKTRHHSKIAIDLISSSGRAPAVRTRRAADMKCKSDQIRTAWAGGDRIGALRIAARFFDRSNDTKAFKRGMDAYNNPDFYRQIGKQPEQIVCAALEALAKRFSLQ
jgi:hypothetical protein